MEKCSEIGNGEKVSATQIFENIDLEMADGPGSPRNKNKSQISTESGFTGNSDSWFDNERYSRPRVKANFRNKSIHNKFYQSYSSHHIHEEMLKDTNRTNAYQRAIEGNPEDFRGKVVLDVGCGTGILAIFAARAGAAHVYAIDNAEVALFAKQIVDENGFSDRITVIKGKMEEVELPFGEGEIDIIVSEWMGYFLLYGSVLDSVIWARDKYLNKKTGKMLPDRVTMHVAAIEDQRYKQERKKFWKDVYGVNMSSMTNSMYADPQVTDVSAFQIMSDSSCVLDLDLMTMKRGDAEFANSYSVNILSDYKVDALVAWFDVLFCDLERPAVLTTSPKKKLTHWRQTVFYLKDPLEVKKGDKLSGSIACRKDRISFRKLNVKISFHKDNYHGE